MRFVLDENFPKAAQNLLLLRGHDVADVRGSIHEGSDDDAVFRWAQE